MASPNLSDLIFYSSDNAFKNVNSYSGSVTFPTSVLAGATATVTSVITLTDTPVFTNFFANFLQITDAEFSTGSAQWYTSNESGGGDIGIHVSAPGPDVGWLDAFVYPVINGNTVTMTGSVFNPFSGTITLDLLTVPFVFVEFTLAN